MKAELIPVDGSDPIPITKDVTVLGRREFCDVQIDHPSLSKRHCVLVKTDGLLVIRDLASTNGTKVKGQKIRWAALLPDDKITLGSVKFRVYLGPDEALSPSERGTGAGPGVGVGQPAFASPAPYPPETSATRVTARPSALARPVEVDDDGPPLILDEAAWRNALGSDDDDSDDSGEIIDLD